MNAARCQRCHGPDQKLMEATVAERIAAAEAVQRSQGRRLVGIGSADRQ